MSSNPAQASCSAEALHGEYLWQVKADPLACREIFGQELRGLGELGLGVGSEGLVACNGRIGKQEIALD